MVAQSSYRERKADGPRNAKRIMRPQLSFRFQIDSNTNQNKIKEIKPKATPTMLLDQSQTTKTCSWKVPKRRPETRKKNYAVACCFAVAKCFQMDRRRGPRSNETRNPGYPWWPDAYGGDSDDSKVESLSSHFSHVLPSGEQICPRARASFGGQVVPPPMHSVDAIEGGRF